VVREQADVHHVRVGEDQVRRAADLAAVLDGRVAVVDRGPQRLEAIARQRAELILCECLRGVEVECAVPRVACERGEHRQVERERLAGCGPGRDDEVLAAHRRIPGGALVRVEPVDGDRVADTLVEIVGERHGARLTRGLVAAVGQLLGALEELDRERGDRHPPIVLTPSAVAARRRVDRPARSAPRPPPGEPPTFTVDDGRRRDRDNCASIAPHPSTRDALPPRYACGTGVPRTGLR
jgi:hypothetical protein